MALSVTEARALVTTCGTGSVEEAELLYLILIWTAVETGTQGGAARDSCSSERWLDGEM